MKLEIHKYLSTEITLRVINLCRYYDIYNQRITFTIPNYMLTNNVLIFTK